MREAKSQVVSRDVGLGREVRKRRTPRRPVAMTMEQRILTSMVFGWRGRAWLYFLCFCRLASAKTHFKAKGSDNSQHNRKAGATFRR